MTDNATILHDYLKEIERYYKLGIAKEHSYRSTLQIMLPKLVPEDRKGRVLTFEDIQHYQRVVAALAETIELMGRIDVAIEEHGGWPIE